MANNVTGRVNRIQPSSLGVNIRLSGIPANDTPKNGYFRLEIGHSNYNALYSLALVAAVNNYDLTIRIDGDDIDPLQDSPTTVEYMFIDF